MTPGTTCSRAPRSPVPVAMLAACLLLLAFPSPAFAQVAQEAGERVVASGTHEDMSFFAGDRVQLALRSSDDVFAAGGDVRVAADTIDHLFIGGGTVRISEVDARDVLAAGGDLTFAGGRARDDVVVAGGEIVFEPGFTIGSSAVLAGGDLRIASPIGGDLRAAGGTLYVNSAVAGNARLMGDRVTLGPDARIEGNLEYRSDRLVVEPGAFVGGQRIRLAPHEDAQFEQWGKAGGSMLLGFFVAFVLGMAVLVAAVTLAAPGLMHASAATIRQMPLRTVGIGFLVAVGMPFFLVALFATIVGIPLALLLVAILIALTPLSLAVTATFIGQLERRLVKKDGEALGWERFAWPVLGIFTLVLIGLVPFVGPFAWILALVVGLGAAVERGGRALARASDPVVQPEDRPRPIPGL